MTQQDHRMRCPGGERADAKLRVRTREQSLEGLQPEARGPSV